MSLSNSTWRLSTSNCPKGYSYRNLLFASIIDPHRNHDIPNYSSYLGLQGEKALLKKHRLAYALVRSMIMAQNTTNTNEMPISRLIQNNKIATNIATNTLRFRIYLSIQYHKVQNIPTPVPTVNQKNSAIESKISCTLLTP